jgi:hypothetical protein
MGERMGRYCKQFEHANREERPMTVYGVIGLRRLGWLLGGLAILLHSSAAGANGPCFGFAQMQGLERTPMAGTQPTLVTTAYAWNVDPRLVLAIGNTESHNGLDGGTCVSRHNAWGWGGGPPNCTTFTTWDSGVATVTAGLRSQFLNQGLTTIDAINGVYCCGRPDRCNVHPECNPWTANVTNHYLFY